MKNFKHLKNHKDIYEEKIIQQSSEDYYIRLPKITIETILIAVIVLGFLINQFFIFKTGIFNDVFNLSSASIKSSGMRLTSFDVALAKEMMDKNNDGICDECGMSVAQCIDSGQIDCTMTNKPNGMGILGSAHTHADFKVYINGIPMDFAKQEYYMKSSFLHVDNNQNKEDSSSVLHMHAKKVPIWLFFKSIGLKLEKDSLTLFDGQILKNENSNTLKYYLNGKKVDELGNYSFQPLDKLLISFGPENDPDIQRQINSVTNFAKDHQK